MSSSTKTRHGLKFTPRLSVVGHPFDAVNWERREAVIQDSKGRTIFKQADVEVPPSWSQTATNIVASKYLHGQIGTSERESGVRDLIDRVVSTIARWGSEDGYFDEASDAKIFEYELTALLVNQYAAFNSPVWFNVGCDQLEPDNQSKTWHWIPAKGNVEYSAAGYKHPQCSACFINSVEDSMESILELAKTEGMLFKYGSGTGTNYSPIRGSMEPLSGGGAASGPLSFMRGYDAFAGVIKSGGKTRRAAKMAILDIDHPDIEDFIACKGGEEAKAQALIAAGYDGNGPDSEAYSTISYQNANNSVRVTDAFMLQVIDPSESKWPLAARSNGSTIKEVDPKALFHQIAEQSWRCGDPGIQFDTTINSWHTCQETGRINASNPCSEYMFLDNSACNLASLNLVKFLQGDTFDVELFAHAVRILIVAQDILVDRSGYPTEQIAVNSHDYRPLGLGYANLGALLMTMGLAYDSDKGRSVAGAITSLMGGTAYRTSAELAEHMPPLVPANHNNAGSKTGAFPGYIRNRQSFLDVIRKHRDAAEQLRSDEEELPEALRDAAVRPWIEAEDLGRVSGFRNAQVTVLAPTGTIGFMMDCDTTGIEPMLGVIVFKKLVGGGNLTIVNNAVGSALIKLGYGKAAAKAIEAHIQTEGTIEGAPDLREEHLSVFDCAFRPAKGTRSIHWRGHIAMMAVVQPFLSGAISKTVNLPEEATVGDIENAYLTAWEMDLKAVAIYRDGSKSSQPVSVKTDAPKASETAPEQPNADLSGPPRATRHRLQDERVSVTHKFGIAGHEGYITVGLYPNGQPGEIFIRMAKEGSTIAGLMESFGTMISVGLQHGVPLNVICAKLAHTRFEPSGWTGNENIRYAKSIMDYIARWLELRFLSGTQLDLFSRQQKANCNVEQLASNLAPAVTAVPGLDLLYALGDAPLCSDCGSLMITNGSCFKCAECGGTSGCS
jgi:ribonucleoside-diphosphate reductase alpha chain